MVDMHQNNFSSCLYDTIRHLEIFLQRITHQTCTFALSYPGLKLRLAIITLMKCYMDEFACHYGIKCSSFCKVNVGTSMRAACASLGHILYESVHTSNKLLERKLLSKMVSLTWWEFKKHKSPCYHIFEFWK